MALSKRDKTIKLTQMSMLVALVIVLQLISAFLSKIIPGLPFSITLTLIPVVIGSIIFGVNGGAILGFFFSLIVLINCITGLDIGGAQLWAANPLLTALLCFAKGIPAGIVPAFIYKTIYMKNEKRKLLATILAAISAPIVNTSIFVGGALIFFMDILKQWAGGQNMLLYIIVGLAGVNFIFEFTVNLVLSPAIMRIISIVGRNKQKRIKY